MIRTTSSPGTIPGERQRPSWKSVLGQLPDYAAPVALVVVWLAFFIATPNFLTVANISDLLVASTILAVVALGQQLAVVVAGIDLSVAANLPWGAALMAWAITSGWPTWLAIALAVLACTAIGLINGALIGYAGMTDFVVTLGMLSLVSGITLLLTQGNTVSVNKAGLQAFALDGIGGIRWFWIAAVAAAALLAFVLFRTKVGTHLLAAGGNADAARGTGISPARMRLLAYAGAGLMVGLGAVMMVARNGGADPSLQTSYLLSSIAAVVLGGSSLFGGKASIVGTITGAVLLTSLINGFTIIGISQYYQPVAVGAVVLMAALIARFRK